MSDNPLRSGACARFFKNLKMREQNRLKLSHFSRLSGRLKKGQQQYPRRFPFCRGTCNLIEPEDSKHIETLCKFECEGHCLA